MKIDRSIAFPSLGYFGGTASDYLSIKLPVELKAIELTVDSPNETFMNLRGVELLRSGSVIKLDDANCQTGQSSFRRGDSTRDSSLLLAKRGMHSAKGKLHRWSVTFTVPVDADELRIYNRTDGWGHRSRELSVHLAMRDGTTGSYDVGGASREDGLIANLASLVGENPDRFRSELFGSETGRECTIEKIHDHLKSRLAPLDRSTSNDILCLIPTVGDYSWSSKEIYVVSRILVDQKRRNPNTSTGIKSFSLVLNSRSRLSELQDAIETCCIETGVEKYIISRHGISREGILRRDVVSNLEHMRGIILLLQSHGYKSYLGYGTLLGAVREQSFIQHDDDVDIMYLAKTDSRESLMKEIESISKILRSKGFDVSFPSLKYTNVHVRDRKSQAIVDLFPIFKNGEYASMHMEKMIERDIKFSIIEPSSLVILHDQLFPAPCNSEAFLRERYSESWNVSDAYYEWPWKLLS